MKSCQNAIYVYTNAGSAVSTVSLIAGTREATECVSTSHCSVVFVTVIHAIETFINIWR